MLSCLSKAFSFSRSLVLIRHGETHLSKEKRWAGWLDTKLVKEGIIQAQECAIKMKQRNIKFDYGYSSMLLRSIKSMNYILDGMALSYLPVTKTWRLNQKHYGSLQGDCKAELTQKYGEDLVDKWRRSFDVKPPALDPNSPEHPRNNIRYKHVPADLLPNCECLSDVIERVRPLWNDEIKAKLLAGDRVLVVAHGSSIRALSHLVGNLSPQSTVELKVPAGIPMLYHLDDKLQIKSFQYLADETEITEKLDKMKNEVVVDHKI